MRWYGEKAKSKKRRASGNGMSQRTGDRQGKRDGRWIGVEANRQRRRRKRNEADDER
jgi:hypothetical protein